MDNAKRGFAAKVISYLFLPPIVNLASFIAVTLKFESKTGNPLGIIGYTSLFTVFLPIFVFILFLRKGKIADADARERKERHIPYLVFAVIIFIGFLIIPWNDHASEIKYLFLIYLFNLLTLFFVNLFWKISAHTMGAGGLLATLLFSFGYWGLIASPVIIVLGWSRYELKCHTVGQITAGAVLGVINTLILFNLFPLL